MTQLVELKESKGCGEWKCCVSRWFRQSDGRKFNCRRLSVNLRSHRLAGGSGRVFPIGSRCILPLWSYIVRLSVRRASPLKPPDVFGGVCYGVAKHIRGLAIPDHPAARAGAMGWGSEAVASRRARLRAHHASNGYVSPQSARSESMSSMMRNVSECGISSHSVRPSSTACAADATSYS